VNLGVLAAVSAPTAGLVIALIALYRAKAQQKLDLAQQAKLEQDLNKVTANRRIMLERYADDVARYHRDLRQYLLDLVDRGIIDASRVDLTAFPRPPVLPVMNGSHD
jgi:hypothetical protein